MFNSECFRQPTRRKHGYAHKDGSRCGKGARGNGSGIGNGANVAMVAPANVVMVAPAPVAMAAAAGAPVAMAALVHVETAVDTAEEPVEKVAAAPVETVVAVGVDKAEARAYCLESTLPPSSHLSACLCHPGHHVHHL